MTVDGRTRASIIRTPKDFRRFRHHLLEDLSYGLAVVKKSSNLLVLRSIDYNADLDEYRMVLIGPDGGVHEITAPGNGRSIAQLARNFASEFVGIRLPPKGRLKGPKETQRSQKISGLSMLKIAAVALPSARRADWLAEQRGYLWDLPTRHAKLRWAARELRGMPLYAYTVRTSSRRSPV